NGRGPCAADGAAARNNMTMTRFMIDWVGRGRTYRAHARNATCRGTVLEQFCRMPRTTRNDADDLLGNASRCIRVRQRLPPASAATLVVSTQQAIYVVGMTILRRIAIGLAILSAAAQAQQPLQDGQVIPLWSGPAPGALGSDTTDIPAMMV